MTATIHKSEKAEQRWNQIVERFRQACIQHKKGEIELSRGIMKEELPQLIRGWIQLLPLSLREEAKEDLRDMFDREQAIVDQGEKLQRMFKETLVKKIIPQLESKIAAKYRAMYVSRIDRRAEKRNSVDRLDSWVNPSYVRNLENQSATGRPRVAIGDVSGMIDALQADETTPASTELAESVTALDLIVDSLNEAGINPKLVSA